MDTADLMYLMENSYLKHCLFFQKIEDRTKIEENPIFIQKPAQNNTGITVKRRFGKFYYLYGKLRRDPSYFKEYTKMEISTFDYILRTINPYLRKCLVKSTIPAAEKLLITLRYLITGKNYTYISKVFKISLYAIKVIVSEVCKGIWLMLAPRHMPELSKPVLNRVVNEFWCQMNFPNCIGCIDSSRIWVRQTQVGFSCELIMSLGLLTVTDANSKFIEVNVYPYYTCKKYDGFRETQLKQRIDHGLIKIPHRSLLNSNEKMPCVFVGDHHFQLKRYLLKPYPKIALTDKSKEIFNEKLHEVRKVVKIAIGSLEEKFKIIHKPLPKGLNQAIYIVKAITMLHNVIHDFEPITDEEKHIFQEAYQKRRLSLTRKHRGNNNNATRVALKAREAYKNFFAPTIKLEHDSTLCEDYNTLDISQGFSDREFLSLNVVNSLNVDSALGLDTLGTSTGDVDMIDPNNMDLEAKYSTSVGLEGVHQTTVCVEPTHATTMDSVAEHPTSMDLEILDPPMIGVETTVIHVETDSTNLDIEIKDPDSTNLDVEIKDLIAMDEKNINPSVMEDPSNIGVENIDTTTNVIIET